MNNGVALPILFSALLCACAAPVAEAAEPAPAPVPTPALFADVEARGTASSANATAAAAYAMAIEARVRAQAVADKGTALARATDRSLETEATQVALAATATTLALRATTDLGAVIATQTAMAISQRGTADALSRDGAATAASLAVTQSAVSLQHAEDRVEASWQSEVVTPVRTVGLVLMAFALAAGAGWCGLRLFDAVVLRARVVKDASGQVVLFSEPDRVGRQTVIVPARSPGAVMQITPPQLAPSTVMAEAVDPETTQRAQVIEGLRASHGNPRPVESPLSTPQPIRVVQQLPMPQIADTHAIQAMDSDWHSRRINV